jgi:hypothetical protein
VILHGDLKGKGGCSFFVADVEKYKPINSNKAFYDNDIAQIFYDAVLQTFIDNHTFEVVSGNVVADVRIHAKEGKGPCIVVKGHTKNEELVTQHSGINISSCKFTGFNAVMKDTGDIKACTKAAFVFNLLNCLFSQTEDSGGTFYPSAVG